MRVAGWLAALALAVGVSTSAGAATIPIANGGSYAYDPANAYYTYGTVNEFSGPLALDFEFQFGALVAQTLVVTWHIPSDPVAGSGIADLMVGWGSDLHAVTDAGGNKVEDTFVLTAGPDEEHFIVTGAPFGSFAYYDITISAVPIAHAPIPSAALLFGSVLAGAGVWRIRRKKASAATG